MEIRIKSQMLRDGCYGVIAINAIYIPAWIFLYIDFLSGGIGGCLPIVLYFLLGFPAFYVEYLVKNPELEAFFEPRPFMVFLTCGVMYSIIAAFVAGCGGYMARKILQLNK